MGDAIRTKDGKTEFVGRDRHFQDLLRQYIGDDAADYYEQRITGLTQFFDDMETTIACGETENHPSDVIEDIENLVSDAKKSLGWDA